MSFWDLDDGTSAVTGKKEYVQDTGNFDPIPDGSNVMAVIEEAKWDTVRNGNEEFISLRWSVEAPEQFLNRKIFQKLWVTDDDPNAKDAAKAKAKRDKAKRMLAAIDANCGGKLAKTPRKPTNDDLALALTMKPMVIKCMVWEMKDGDGKSNSGNWISAVFPKSKGVEVKESAAPKKADSKAGSFADDLDGDIPF
jgi:hypothetical protein